MNSKKINVNNMPKGFKLFFLLLPLIGLFLIAFVGLDNDFYFLYPTGEYIVKNGFPTTDILSMHSSMSIIVQQWLSTVIFYFVYSKFKLAGMIALLSACYLAIMALSYKLCKRISDNFFISAVCAMSIDFLLATAFIVTRPQVFTYIIILLELYLLESYVKEKSAKWLIPIPLLSLLLINLHASMWLMLFVFAAPYAFSALPIKKLGQPHCKLIPLLIAGAVSLAAGFINPYGIKAMLYIFTSFGQSEISGVINEMKPVSIGNATGIVFAGAIATLAIIATIHKGKLTSRFVLLFAGSLLLGAMSIKGLSYFYIIGISSFSYYVKDIELAFTVTEGSRSKKDKTKIVILSLLIVFLVAFIGVYSSTPNAQKDTYSDKLTYEELDDISDILDSADEKLVLFAGFDNGNYLEFKGFHPYIDGRAELFTDKNNGEFNYMKEYGELYNSSLYYKEFIDKYNFNYLVVKNSELPLYQGLIHDNDYELLYEGKIEYLFKQKK